MKIVIAGGSGLIGRALSARLAGAGHEVVVLSRQPQTGSGAQMVQWDGHAPGPWQEALQGAGALINLCGASIGEERWTPARKLELRTSRTGPSIALARACAGIDDPPKVLLQASGVGVYGPSETASFDESSPPGDDFLACLAQEWERAGTEALPPGTRRVVMRIGVVWSRAGGALERLVLPFRLFAGGPIGSGRQFLSWIHIDDLTAAIEFLAGTDGIAGAVNLVAPENPRNTELARAIAKALDRPSWFPIPSWAMRLALGEMSTLVLEGQRVIPRVLQEAGFRFSYPNVDSALAQILAD
ncbi:MAG: TIGR01777 family protein [Pseudomonadales bacterium]|nr:TIGR01777 family protein [Pseudomonadales bacterium]NIX07891.1 TIGR01777 family protein [Pseudomonadales bacterium]